MGLDAKGKSVRTPRILLHFFRCGAAHVPATTGGGMELDRGSLETS